MKLKKDLGNMFQKWQEKLITEISMQKTIEFNFMTKNNQKRKLNHTDRYQKSLSLKTGKKKLNC